MPVYFFQNLSYYFLLQVYINIQNYAYVFAQIYVITQSVYVSHTKMKNA
jgi:hypothetical protein